MFIIIFKTQFILNDKIENKTTFDVFQDILYLCKIIYLV